MNGDTRTHHPKIILGIVGVALVIPLIGITISLVGASANTQQEVSMREVSMREVSMREVSMRENSAQRSIVNESSLQQETVRTVVDSAAVVVESMPAQAPLPDPLAPEPTRDSAPSASVSGSVSGSETQEQEPPSAPKATATAPKVEKVTQPVVTEQVVDEPKTVKKATEVAGGWTAPVLNTGTVSLRAPKLSSGQRVTLTVACSPSANCVINGDQLTIDEGTHVTVTYRAKATDTYRAWTTIIRS